MEKLTKDNVFQLFQQLTGLHNQIKSLNEEFPGDPLIERAVELNEKVLSYQAQVEESKGENIPAELGPLAQKSYFAMVEAVNRNRGPCIKRLTRSETLKLFPFLAKINKSMEKLVRDDSSLAVFAGKAMELNEEALTFEEQVKGASGETIPDELQSIIERSITLMNLVNLASNRSYS